MARPASRKADSSLPAMAKHDEQLDEVVMELKPKPVKLITQIIEYECDRCLSGRMNEIPGEKLDIIEGEIKFIHKCSKCGHEAWLKDRYPKLIQSYKQDL